MKFFRTRVVGFENALYGMRNAKNSWNKIDSEFGFCKNEDITKEMVILHSNNGISEYAIIGENDMKLAQTLIKAGSEHRKFLRQIQCEVTIEAPIYWWKEFSTYKVGTVANSTSTMHKLASTPITEECFEHEKLSERINPMSEVIKKHRLSDIDYLERLRKECNNTVNKDIKREIWKALIEDLPESWLQKRTVTMNYENILNMVRQRTNHKLSEWSKSFIDWVKSLPYADELIFFGGVDG